MSSPTLFTYLSPSGYQTKQNPLDMQDKLPVGQRVNYLTGNKEYVSAGQQEQQAVYQLQQSIEGAVGDPYGTMNQQVGCYY